MLRPRPVRVLIGVVLAAAAVSFWYRRRTPDPASAGLLKAGPSRIRLLRISLPRRPSAPRRTTSGSTSTRPRTARPSPISRRAISKSSTTACVRPSSSSSGSSCARRGRRRRGSSPTRFGNRGPCSRARARACSCSFSISVTSTSAGSYNIRKPLVDALDKVIGADDLVGVMTPEMSASDITFARKTTTIDGMLTPLLELG